MIDGEGKNPGSTQLLKLAEKFNIKNAKAIVEEVKEVVHKWPEFAKLAGVSKASAQTIRKETDRLILS